MTTPAPPSPALRRWPATSCWSRSHPWRSPPPPTRTTPAAPSRARCWRSIQRRARSSGPTPPFPTPLCRWPPPAPERGAGAFRRPPFGPARRWTSSAIWPISAPGENYSSPADGNSDAVIAVDLTTGERVWDPAKHRRGRLERGLHDGGQPQLPRRGRAGLRPRLQHGAH